jgi:mono/diheme cytochrome c family protein
MPPARVWLSDQDIADVATFIRSSWGNKARAVRTDEVRSMRNATDSSSDRVIVLKMR